MEKDEEKKERYIKKLNLNENVRNKKLCISIYLGGALLEKLQARRASCDGTYTGIVREALLKYLR